MLFNKWHVYDSTKINVVANLCKYKYKNIFFRNRQKSLKKNASGIIFFIYNAITDQLPLIVFEPRNWGLWEEREIKLDTI